MRGGLVLVTTALAEGFVSLAAHGLGIAGGPALIWLVFPRVKRRLLRRDSVKRMPPRPKDEDAYWDERRRIFKDIYLKYLDQYHKLLLWAAGGAFFASYSAVQILARETDTGLVSQQQTIGYLVVGWLCLSLSIIIEIGSPYATTRMASDSMEALRLLHEGENDDATTARLKSEGWGNLTRLLNENAYRVLVLGFWYVGVYVVLNLVPVTS